MRMGKSVVEDKEELEEFDEEAEMKADLKRKYRGEKNEQTRSRNGKNPEG